MIRNTDQEAVEICQAKLDGKIIQKYGWFKSGKGGWMDDSQPFNFSNYIYRIKPEPMEIWKVRYKNTNGNIYLENGFFLSEREAQIVKDSSCWYLDTIHFRQVMDDE